MSVIIYLDNFRLTVETPETIVKWPIVLAIIKKSFNEYTTGNIKIVVFTKTKIIITPEPAFYFPDYFGGTSFTIKNDIAT